MNQNNQSDQSSEKKAPEIDEPILDLTESADTTQESGGDASMEVDPLAATIVDESFDDGFDDDQDDDDFVDSLGMEIGAQDDEEEDFSAPGYETDEVSLADVPGALDVSPEQLDAALERVIQKMFYDRIDRILVNVIEKRVKMEIDRIKGMERSKHCPR